jgi:hypothetical protein
VAGVNLQWQATEPALTAAFRALSTALSDADFYLADGTALTLQDGHRISRHRPLSQYLDLFRTKYASRDVGHVVRSLTYFDDAEEEPDPRLLVPLPWDRVKTDLLRWVAGLLPG